MLKTSVEMPKKHATNQRNTNAMWCILTITEYLTNITIK